jgi:hypothetical protein
MKASGYKWFVLCCFFAGASLFALQPGTAVPRQHLSLKQATPRQLEITGDSVNAPDSPKAIVDDSKYRCSQLIHSCQAGLTTTPWQHLPLLTQGSAFQWLLSSPSINLCHFCRKLDIVVAGEV